MTPSDNIDTFIKGFEKLRLAVFLPTPNDKPTIGWGHTGPDVTMGMPDWTEQQADDMFITDMDFFADHVTACITSHFTAQNQFDAMCSFAYNVGAHNFATSTLLQMHNTENYEGAKAQFARWNKQAGQVLAGLTRRRAAEAALYGTP